MTRRISTPIPRSLLATGVVTGLFIAGASASAALRAELTDPPSPATGHAQVVATWLVDFTDGPHEWGITQHTVDTVGIDLSHTAPTFLIGDADWSVAITGPEVRARLSDGEALFRRPTLTTHAAALGDSPATLTELWISTNDVDAGSEPIVPGAGTHDVDIVRDWLAAGETMTLQADIPAFVMVTDGWVTDADGNRIDAGGWATLAGEIALTNGGSEAATVLIAVIGPVLDLPPASTTTTPTTTAAPATTAPATTAPATTQPADTTTTTTTSTTSTDPVATEPVATEPVETEPAPETTTTAPTTTVWSSPPDSTDAP